MASPLRDFDQFFVPFKKIIFESSAVRVLSNQLQFGVHGTWVVYGCLREGGYFRDVQGGSGWTDRLIWRWKFCRFPWGW